MALEAGAEDVREDEDTIEVITDVSQFESVKKVFDQHNMKYQVGTDRDDPADIREARRQERGNHAQADGGPEDSDDVQNVHANFDISLQEMERISQ